MKPFVLFDLRQDSLSVCRIDRDTKAILNRESYPIPSGELLPSEISGSFDPSAECYLNLHLGLLNFRIVEMPFSDLKKIRESLPFELEGLILGGVSSIVFDVAVIGEEAGRYRIFVAYMDKKTLGNILGFLKRLGAEPRLALSLELAEVLRTGGQGDFAELLLAPPALPDDMLVEAGLREISKSSFNFRRNELAYTVDDRKQKKTLRLAAVLAALIVLIMLADMTIVAVATGRDNRAIKEGLRKTYLSVYPNEKKVADEVYQMKAHLRELQEKEVSYVGVSPLEVMLDLSRVSRPGTSFTEVAIDSSLITMKGECPSLGDAEKIKTDLGTYFSGVNIMETKPSSQGRTQFTITAKGTKP